MVIEAEFKLEVLLYRLPKTVILNKDGGKCLDFATSNE